jgi:hypothetical protein
MKLFRKHNWNIALRKETVFDRFAARVLNVLNLAEGRKLAHGLLTLLRLRHWNSRVPQDKEQPANSRKPLGPFVVVDKKKAGDILLFVPRHLYGRMLDDISGGYGYSHLTVDCGEIDVSSGKRVMVEAMPNTPVHRSFLDEYGDKQYARISLDKTGIDPEEFCKCVKDMIGESYDYAEVVTWGDIDDPAKQVCTDLAAGCLPEEVQRDFANKRRSGELNKKSVSVYHARNKGAKVFISPNGFAEYFDLPHGDQIKKRGQRFTPEGPFPQEAVSTSRPRPWGRWLVLGLVGVGILLVGNLILKRSKR